ncbi:Adenylyltransferase and sulfurtransferase MOCS3 [Quillaja saponaria]|uniref:Adenylyltransferase and sulfurtransferase MOCS3 n=1 Tax=Quillaja saponaria TaxID=32244 RepID=A0AAD7PQU6_QUISA|nr:Adenylyltransferase and sulfurtransferase MOCS3 [Quillaja saponaria]
MLLTVYNYNGGPCYWCLFPTPPPTTACQRCADSGFLGVVPGIIGCLQALEAIKIAVNNNWTNPFSQVAALIELICSVPPKVKIRGRSVQCEVCGGNSTFDRQQFLEFDYEKFTQTPLSVSPLKLNLFPTDSRISSKEYNERILDGEAHVLVDVWPSHHYKIVSLPKSLNIPLATLEARLPEISSALKEEEERKGYWF